MRRIYLISVIALTWLSAVAAQDESSFKKQSMDAKKQADISLKKQAPLKKTLDAKKMADLKKQAALKKQSDLKKQALENLKKQAVMKKQAELKKQAYLDAKKQAQLKKMGELKKQALLKKQAEMKKSVKKSLDLKKMAELKKQAALKKQGTLGAKKGILDAKKMAELKKQAALKKQSLGAKKMLDAKKMADIKKQAALKKQGVLGAKKGLLDAKKMAELKKQAALKKQSVGAKKTLDAKKMADIKKQANLKKQSQFAKKQADLKKQANFKKQLLAKKQSGYKKQSTMKKQSGGFKKRLKKGRGLKKRVGSKKRAQASWENLNAQLNSLTQDNFGFGFDDNGDSNSFGDSWARDEEEEIIGEERKVGAFDDEFSSRDDNERYANLGEDVELFNDADDMYDSSNLFDDTFTFGDLGDDGFLYEYEPTDEPYSENGGEDEGENDGDNGDDGDDEDGENDDDEDDDSNSDSAGMEANIDMFKYGMRGRSAVASREDLRKDYWMDIYKISENIADEKTRKIIIGYFQNDFIPNYYDTGIMNEDILDQNSESKEKRFTIAKNTQLHAISSWLSTKTNPKTHQSDYYQNFVKFQGYGCHCAPTQMGKDIANLDHFDMVRGTKGEPLDQLDRSCHERNACYRCAELEYGKAKCDYRFSYDMTFTDVNDIKCNDPLNTCQRALCDCDKRWFYQRHLFEATYSPGMSHQNGFSLEFGTCNGKEDTKGKWDKCCGIGEKRRPYNSAEGQVCCANTVIYKPALGGRCCSGGYILRGNVDQCRDGDTEIEVEMPPLPELNTQVNNEGSRGLTMDELLG